MENANPSTVYYVLGSIAIVGGFVARWLSARDKDQETRFDSKLLLATNAHKELKDNLDVRIAAMKVEIKEASLRLALVERDYISRADHAQFRSELMAAVKEIGSQVTHSLDGFRSTVDKVIERVNDVEREAARK